MYKTCISDQNIRLIVKYALTLQIFINTHHKSSPNEPLLCNWFADKFSGRYKELTEYASHAKLKAL
jgi:hypothetical protein